MLPDARPFTATDADRWLHAGLPRWVTSIALPSLWAVALVVAAVTDSTRCTPQDPSVCGPDSIFAFAFVVVMATPVLLWWMPVLGCAAGVLFALADLRYDDVQGARWAFGLHGLLCALVAVRLVWGAAQQRRIAGAASAGGRIPAAGDVPSDAFASSPPRWTAAGLLVLAGIGFFAWYGHEVSDEQAHLRRAVQVQGRIVAVRSDESIKVAVRTPSAGTREYRLGVYDYTDSYPLRSSTPVLLDPQDPDWIRQVAEPRDSTGWQSAGAGCFALAFCLLLHRERWRRGLRALGSSDHPALRVRIRPDEEGTRADPACARWRAHRSCRTPDRQARGGRGATLARTARCGRRSGTLAGPRGLGRSIRAGPAPGRAGPAPGRGGRGRRRLGRRGLGLRDPGRLRPQLAWRGAARRAVPAGGGHRGRRAGRRPARSRHRDAGHRRCGAAADGTAAGRSAAPAGNVGERSTRGEPALAAGPLAAAGGPPGDLG